MISSTFTPGIEIS